MNLYSENKNYKLYQGNMLDMLEVIEPSSIDSIITDPPYELNFMNKGWDNSGIAFQPDTWKKCYEVLKPGGYLLAFGGSRTFHRIAVAIEDAGFEIRDTIMWLYGSGFPKSMDISKQIDKRGGNNTSFLCNLIKEKREEKNLSQKKLDELMGTSGMVNWWEKGERGITPIQFNKLCEILELPFKNIEEAEREIIGHKEKLESYQYKGNNVYQTNGNKEKIILGITKPSTDLAKQWQGWGTALKPSFEPIIVARKPFKGSLVDNVIEHGVGGINIDECRVETSDNIKPTKRGSGVFSETANGKITGWNKDDYNGDYQPNEQGRFPANTILTYDETDFDEVCGGFPQSKSKGAFPKKINGKSNITFRSDEERESRIELNDSGSASRYFYCAKASKKDRDEGLDEFEDKYMAFSNQAKAELKRGNVEFKGNEDNPMNFVNSVSVRKNTHPTVKPTTLMQYLVRLVTPNGGTILDPFNGSGSTGKAVMYENKERNKNYKYIGIELTEEYLPISKARIEYVCNLKEEVKERQTSLFDD